MLEESKSEKGFNFCLFNTEHRKILQVGERLSQHLTAFQISNVKQPLRSFHGIEPLGSYF